ncbi:hypothetical protein O181_063888 [Austropuccinia psidii MF-1]|uniref:Uncharacterized protein n=1 Tax=Austropuccinia psidii MF-1 TaxID=1389203 RepID=A0A9Q3ESH4_9BASI|nr:hypothetical protein [Austropuccinia psidii MF-1]
MITDDAINNPKGFIVFSFTGVSVFSMACLFQNSPPAKNTRSQRNPAVLTPTEGLPPDRTPSIHQLSANLDRGPPMEGAAPSRTGGMKSRR